MQLDNIDQKLLNRLQIDFPLVSQPYAHIGWDLGISEEETIRRIQRLKSQGTIRQIGPLFDAKKLNYKTTLVAARATGAEFDRMVQLFADYPVSHAYERDHHYNLWFTLAIPEALDADAELKQMFSAVKYEACFSLPAVKLFKLRTFFNSGADEFADISDTAVAVGSQPHTELSETDRKVINEIQQDLPLISRPFETMAGNTEMSEKEFLEQSRSLLTRGIMRRFSVSVNHRQVGFVANAMTCWQVSEEKIEQAGQKLASLREVSHCYERRTNPLWKHNLFAMIHGQSKEHCQHTADEVSAELDLNDGIMLYSTREFKKTRLKYTV